MKEQRDGKGNGRRRGGRLSARFAFFRQRSVEIHRFLLWLGLSAVDADDLIQGMWLKYFANPPEPKGENAEEHWRGWLLTVVRHEMMDLFRHRGRSAERSLDDLRREPQDGRAEQAADRENHARLIDWVRERLTELSEKKTLNDRLLYERYAEGRSVRELAAENGLGENAISCRIYQALQKLRAVAPAPDDEDARSG
jgi:RNA polymerase sigma factor (sigma-70 family)